MTRPFDLSEHLMKRAAEELADHIRAGGRDEYGSSYEDGKAAGFFYAAEMVAGFPRGWPTYAEWREWMLAALRATPNAKGITCTNCGAINHYPFGVGDSCRLCGSACASETAQGAA